jgi:putative acetyltransferase
MQEETDMIIRQETSNDAAAIDAVHRAAFAPVAAGAEPVEVGLVRALRSDAGWSPKLSLVAEHEGVVVGHVVCSRGSLGPWAALGLGPIGVLPERQRDGFGGALMHAVLGAADALEHPVVVLLGHLEYYPRFGFVPAGSVGISPTDPAWISHFQARTLGAWRPEMAGTFHYASPFDAL